MASRSRLGIALILCASVFSVFYAALLLSNQKNHSDSFSLTELKVRFPDRITNRISVPVQGSNEERRTEYFDADKVTLRLREIVYKNGVTSYFYFRQNKSAESMEEFYPAEIGSKSRIMKTKIVYEDNGVLFASHQSWRPDGTLIKDGKRLSDDTYRTLTFFPDGKTVERVQNFTKRREMTDETVYRQDNVKARITVVEKNGNRKVTVFRSDASSEVRYMTMIISRYQRSGVKGELYSQDGEQIIANFESTSYKTEIIFLNAEEKPRLSVRFERTVAGHLTIDSLVKDAQVKQSQVYLRREGSVHGCTGSYALYYVDEFAADNSELGRRPFRRIYVGEDGITVKEVAIPDQNYYYAGKGTRYELYPSGFVARKKVYSSHNTVASVTDYADKQYREPATEVTDTSIFKRADFQCPESFPIWSQDKRSWIFD